MMRSHYLFDTLDGLTRLVPGWPFHLRITLLLGLAWLLHLALAWGNPRWRVALWRAAGLGLLLVPLLMWGAPPIQWRVGTAPPATASEQIHAHSEQISASDFAQRASSDRFAADDAVQTVVAPVVSPDPLDRLSEHRWAVLWLVGSVLVLARMGIGWRAMCRLVARSQTAPAALQELAEDVARELGCSRRLGVRVSDDAAAPLIAGPWRPVIVLPRRMIESYDRPLLRGVLAHEFAHCRGGDLYWSMALHLLRAALWFHPLAWRVPAVHEAACERTSDAVSAACMGDVDKYSGLLARVAVEMSVRMTTSAAIPMARQADVSRRLRLLQHRLFDRPLPRRQMVSVAMLGLAGLVLVSVVRIVPAEPGVEGKTAAVAAPESSIPTNIVQVRVVNEDGQAVAGARVEPYALRMRDDMASHYGWNPADHGEAIPVQTDYKGMARVAYPQYVQEKLETGAISIKISHPEYCAVNESSFLVDGSDESITLPRGATLIVAGLIDGRRIQQDLVPQLTRHNDFDWQALPNDSLVIDRVTPGEHYLRLVLIAEQDRGPIYFSDTVRFQAEKAQTHIFDLELRPGLTLVGRLDDSVPRPIRNGSAIVTSYSAETDLETRFPSDEGRRDLGWRARQPIASDGSFVFESLPPGKLEIIASCEGYVSRSASEEGYATMVEPQRFLFGESTGPIELVMIPAASAEVTVLDDLGQPLPDARVAFSPNVQWARSRSTLFMADRDSEELLRRRLNGGRTQLERPRHSFAALTDRQGIATVHNLPPRESETYSVTHPDYEMPARTVHRDVQRRTGVIKLAPSATTTITVKMEKKGTNVLRATEASTDSEAVPLAEAVAAFNRSDSMNQPGENEPPLTVDEVVAAIRTWDRRRHPVDDEVYELIKEIAESRTMPPNAWFRSIRRIGMLDLHTVDLGMTLADKSGFVFRIRDRKIHHQGAEAGANDEPPRPVQPGSIALDVAVHEFNQRAANIENGKNQPLLTADEVLAAILARDREGNPVSDEIHALFQRIVESRTLPANAELHFKTSWVQQDGSRVDVWWVDLDMTFEGGTGYIYRIRDRKIGYRG